MKVRKIVLSGENGVKVSLRMRLAARIIRAGQVCVPAAICPFCSLTHHKIP